MKSNEEYISLFDYRGQASRQTGLGREVYRKAREKGIKIIYVDLPEPYQKPEFNKIATYPVSFLDEYFGKEPEKPAVEPVTDLKDLLRRLYDLEVKFLEVSRRLDAINIAVSNTEDDDLPF